MVKVGGKILDIYDDDTGEIARKLPEDLQSVKVAAHEDIEALPDKAFALVMKIAGGTLRRRFPLHDDDSMKLSKAYFDEVKAELHPEIVKVAEEKFADPASTKVAYIDITKLAPPEKKASITEQHWGLTISGHDCFPLHNEELVKMAVARFPFTINDLYPEERYLYARNLEKRASTCNVPIPEKSPINLYTSETLNKGALKIAIQQRKMAVGSTVGTDVLDQLEIAAGCPLDKGAIETQDSFELRQSKQASLRHLPTERIVGVLQQFDKFAGLGSHQYLRGMLDPFAACFKKQADCGVNSNMFVDGVDLTTVNPKMLADRFDPSFVQEFAENPVQVYKSLPDPVKSVIRQMAENGMDSMSADGAAHKNPPTIVGSGGDPSDRLNPTTANGLYN